jgi:LPS export ABC transporter protein LptC
MIRKFAPVVFSAAVLFFLFLTFWHKGPGSRLTEISLQMEVDMNIRDFSLVQGQEGRTSFELISDNAGFLDDKDVFVLDNPVVTYHGRNNTGPMVIRASQGMVLQQENRVYLWPDVRAHQGGIKASSGKATYMGQDNYILLEDGVVFTGRGITIKSPQAIVSLDDDRIVATGGVNTLLP